MRKMEILEQENRNIDLIVCWSRSDFLNFRDVSCGFCSDMSEKFQSNQSELVILVLSGYAWVASSSAVDVVWNWT